MTDQSNIDAISEDARQRILTAALRLFEQLGYSLATTRSIAKAAGVNEVTLFRQFGSKKQLLMACIEAKNASGFSANFEKELPGNYAADILYMARLQIENTTANLHVLRLMLCDARNIPELREAMLAGGRANLQHLTRYFQRQVEAGIVRKDCPPAVLASAFDSLFSSFVLFENIFQDNLTPGYPKDEVILPLVDLFVRGSLSAFEE